VLTGFPEFVSSKPTLAQLGDPRAAAGSMPHWIPQPRMPVSAPFPPAHRAVRPQLQTCTCPPNGHSPHRIPVEDPHPKVPFVIMSPEVMIRPTFSGPTLTSLVGACWPSSTLAPLWAVALLAVLGPRPSSEHGIQCASSL
jgi:hypothetical protein